MTNAIVRKYMVQVYLLELECPECGSKMFYNTGKDVRGEMDKSTYQYQHTCGECSYTCFEYDKYPKHEEKRICLIDD